jgi:putative membrane protein
MIVAKIVSSEAGDAYLGTQGDPFDAVMDMACAFLGAVACMTVTGLCRQLFHKGPELLAGEETKHPA